jgi:hypothetical protein
MVWKRFSRANNPYNVSREAVVAKAILGDVNNLDSASMQCGLRRDDSASG